VFALAARGSYPLHVIHTLCTRRVLSSSSILFDVRLGVGQVTRTSRVAAADGALDEVTLEDVAASKGVMAQDTHVRPLPGVCDEIIK
jgi:hypothetical protein